MKKIILTSFWFLEILHWLQNVLKRKKNLSAQILNLGSIEYDGLLNKVFAADLIRTQFTFERKQI